MHFEDFDSVNVGVCVYVYLDPFIFNYLLIAYEVLPSSPNALVGNSLSDFIYSFMVFS